MPHPCLGPQPGLPLLYASFIPRCASPASPACRIPLLPAAPHTQVLDVSRCPNLGGDALDLHPRAALEVLRASGCNALRSVVIQLPSEAPLRALQLDSCRQLNEASGRVNGVNGAPMWGRGRSQAPVCPEGPRAPLPLQPYPWAWGQATLHALRVLLAAVGRTPYYFRVQKGAHKAKFVGRHPPPPFWWFGAPPAQTRQPLLPPQVVVVAHRLETLSLSHCGQLRSISLRCRCACNQH